MTARLTPVSENTEGDTVLGRVEAMVTNGCPGPAGLWKCAREFGHEDGEHVRIGAGVSKLKAERDELLAAAKDALTVAKVGATMAFERGRTDEFVDRCEQLGVTEGWGARASAAISKAEEK